MTNSPVGLPPVRLRPVTLLILAAAVSLGCGKRSGEEGGGGDGDGGDNPFESDGWGGTEGGESEASASGGSGGGQRLDVGGGATDGPGGGDCPDGGGGVDEFEFSNIWIANSPQGTVSKIDTVTATEIGRYLVNPTPSGDAGMGPSRTSVSLDGDMIVADRDGGLAKVYAREKDCVDANGNGTIETSTDANFLAWGEDECLAWRVEVPRMTSSNRRGPRTVQWTAPEMINNCLYATPKAWLAFCNESDNDATVWLVDGSDGSIDTEIPIADYQCNTYGPYGGAVDADNNLWFPDRETARLFRVDYDCTPGGGDECWESFDPPDPDMDAYGITIDPDGRVWLAGTNNSLYYYWPENDEWRHYKTELDAYFAGLSAPQASANNILRGLMMDDAGVMWVATIQDWGGGATPGVLRVDTTMDPPAFEFYGPPTFDDTIVHAAGISIDVEGFVWLVDTLGNQAYKMNPDDPTDYVRVEGLELPYTYSDMTGFGLKRVADPGPG